MIVILLPGFAGTLPGRRKSPAPQPSGLPPLSERNALYAACLKLATACGRRSKAGADDSEILELSHGFYEEAMRLARREPAQGIPVLTEAIAAMEASILRTGKRRFPMADFLGHFSFSLPLLLGIAGGDPARLRPINPAPAPAAAPDEVPL